MIVETGPKFDKALKKNPADRQLFERLRRRIEGPPGLTEQEMRSMDGVHLEPIKLNAPYHSIHIGNKLRAICLVGGNTIKFVDLPESHEKSYRGSLALVPDIGTEVTWKGSQYLVKGWAKEDAPKKFTEDDWIGEILNDARDKFDGKLLVWCSRPEATYLYVGGGLRALDQCEVTGRRMGEGATEEQKKFWYDTTRGEQARRIGRPI